MKRGQTSSCSHIGPYVVGTVDKLMHKDQILDRFYVVAWTDCKRSARDATLKIERTGHMLRN